MFELVPIIQKINKRKVDEYKMQIAIVQNPHVKNPGELWKKIEAMRPVEEKKSDKLDVVGFENFKRTLASNPRFIVK